MTLALNQVSTIFLSVALLVLGSFLVKKASLLQRFCIPAPVVGGLLFAIVATVLKASGAAEISLDTSLQSLFMLTFFTTVGLGASFKLIKLGGKLLVIYWIACGFLALAQNVIGVSLASLFGIHPLIGMMAGAVSMEGGHGAATAFGQTVEDLGIPSALAIGIAAATFGLVAGGLVGGPTVKYLIAKHNLKPTEVEDTAKNVEEAAQPIVTNAFFTQVLLITFCMAVGTYLGGLFSTATGFVLPGYVGAMFVAVIVRNVVDKFKPDAIDMKSINLISDVTLGIFLSMALMSIKLWEVAALALPMLVIVFVQVVFIVLFGIFVLFRLLGKNYDAAVMVAGFTGHGLGATPNAMANMAAVTERFGPSRKAYLVVPIVGAFLIDVFAMPIIITTINLLK
ncbi:MULTISPECIES: sodium/glutamate symporter [Brevibacillus]|jgi:sodium--glutamate symport carrier (gltS)|uniref:Sodium/glutamate symporter n=1 Tax=Brevibacillus parabrevis TaxID=54914 RepID=A0A4Y3PPB6_BREPA|nr:MULTISPECIES: sodium/glutamate symporter [Brevibacillus]MDH6352124.1 ESS family glutamate:Na+ symporter [Brevibacillus sp. 1238]MDR4998999.1 sodium/glutamate symporter [Brevibacillus parabrevis]MED2254449.1 sodium/glutamate symporter [Brevibacillus parabrevis]RNB93903.1 sodium/glutamate symporter [Brevibacillus parabrevis]UED67382.1 sodium/glutamate symporter [Brevibacillus sp. HD3.3A]